MIEDSNKPSATLTREDERALARSFVESDAFRLLFYPKLKETIDLAHYNAFMATDKDVKCWWVEHEKALWNIENVWLKNWLAPEESDEADENETGYT